MKKPMTKSDRKLEVERMNAANFFDALFTSLIGSSKLVGWSKWSKTDQMRYDRVAKYLKG